MLSSGSEFASLCGKLVKDDEFGSLTTNESKVDHIFSKVKTINEFREEISKTANKYKESHGKCGKRSEQFRTDADNYFLVKDYSQAIRLYTYALVNAPFPLQGDTEKQLHKCYTSRAKAFFVMGDFSNALHDTEKSIFLGRTNEMLYQKAFCLKSLGRFGEAKAVIDGCLESKGYYKLNEEPELLAKFEDMKVPVDTQFATYGEGPNPLYKDPPPNLDIWVDLKRIEIKQNGGKGREIVAKDMIPRETPIIVEKLENVVLTADNMLSHCSGCFKFVGTQFWPCIFCNEVVFCDRQCHDRGQADFHWHECQIAGILAFSPFYQCFRAVTKVDANYAFKRATKEDREPFDINKWLETFYGRDIEPVFRRRAEERRLHFDAMLDLVDHNEDFTTEEDAKHSLMAIETALIIENKEGFTADDDKTFAEFVAFIVKMFRKTMSNSFSWSQRSLIGPQSVGSCLTIYSSYLNHSCWPNVYWVFNGDRIIIKTCRDIQSGEEIVNSYGPNQNMPLHQRQQILRNHYHFVCKCNLCKLQVNLYPALKCLECKGPVIFFPESRYRSVCFDCGKNYDNITDVLYKVSLLRLVFDQSIRRTEKIMGKDLPLQTPEEQLPEQFEDADEEVKDSEEEAKDTKEEEEAEPQEEPDVETESQKESREQSKREEIQSCLKTAEKALKELIDVHYESVDEIFDLENHISRLYVENNLFAEAVPHFERILASIDWSKCGKSCRHWDNLLFITTAYYQHLKDESVSKKKEWKQCFKSFSALKQSYKTLKDNDKSQQWVQRLTIDGKPAESADAIKELIRDKKANFTALKDVYKRLFSV